LSSTYWFEYLKLFKGPEAIGFPVLLGVNDVFKGINELKVSLRSAFTKIKAEFDEHREAINENTNEIQSNYEYLCKLDAKIDKLSERIDELTLFLQQKTETPHYNISPLTTREKEVFVALYSSHDALTYKEIGRKTGLSENLVTCYIANLVMKGVPVQKRYVNTEVNVFLEPAFKELQLRENIVGISEAVSKNVLI
jgi:hypothetical protein